MNMKKISVVLAYIGIVFIVIFMSTATYAYIRQDYDIEVPIKDNYKLSENLSTKYINTSNLSIVNPVGGDSLVKIFKIKNNSSTPEYYNILLQKVTNDFEDYDNLVYALSSNNAAYVKQSVVPKSDELIASNIKINGGDTHEYKLIISYLEQEDKIKNNNTFSSNIKIFSSNDGINNSNSSLMSKIVSNAISSEEYLDLDGEIEDGVYYTNSTINGSTVYFYRGSNKLNNNVLIGSDCYKIIRTTEDGGIRLIYNGKSVNNACNTTSNIMDGLSTFNNRSNYNAYIGFMYGNASSKNYESEHKNTNSSSIKIYLDSWYLSDFIKYKEFIKNDTIYCNNRVPHNINLNRKKLSNDGYNDKNTGYILFDEYYNTKNISYDCDNLLDRFSVNNIYGNNELTNSVGLITLEELYYAGYRVNQNNSDNFLYSSIPYWTMTSAYFYNNNAYNFIVNKGDVSVDIVNRKHGVRPVITIKDDSVVLFGDGSANNPYALIWRLL